MKLSSGHVGCGFGNPTENFWTEGHKFIAECRKQYEKFFSGKYSFKMVRWKRKILFWQPRRNFSSKRPKRFCSLSWKDGKQYFSGKIHCLKLFLRTRRMQFWRACRNFFHIRPQAFHSRSKKDGKKPEIFSKKNSSQFFDGHVKYCFENPTKIFSSKSGNFFAQCPVMMERNSLLSQKSTLTQNLCRHLTCSFDNPGERISTKCRKFSFSVRKGWKFLQKINLI